MSLNNKSMQDAIANKNVINARSVILRLISKDRRLPEFTTPGLAKFAEAEFAKSEIKFFVEDDGESSFGAQIEWSKDLWDTLHIELEYNFSERKFGSVIEIMQFLRKNGDPEFQISEKYKDSVSTNIEVPNENCSHPCSSTKIAAITGGVVGGAAGILVGYLVGGLVAKAVIGGVVGAVTGGIIGAKKDRKSK